MLSGDETGQQMLFEVSDIPLRKTIFTDGSDSTDFEEEDSPHDESEKT